MPDKRYEIGACLGVMISRMEIIEEVYSDRHGSSAEVNPVADHNPGNASCTRVGGKSDSWTIDRQI
jgi:hypothetical protein